jgi:protein involved in polysaccharide export with SLBB domain
MIWKFGLAGMFFYLAVTSAAGQGEYRLEAGDAVEVWAAQEPELRRDVVVGPDGWISLPLAGHLEARGLSVAELEKALNERLRSYFKDSLDLTVMLQPNPERVPTIFVAGEVATPGAYPFRAGMTVLHGISVAGGLYRSSLLPADQDRAVLVKRELELSQSRVKELTAQIARLQAELDDEDLVTHESSEDASFFAQEQKVLETRRAELTIQQNARRQIREFSSQGAKAIQQQADTLGQRIELTKRRLDSTSKLVAKGYANVAQQLEIEAEIAELEGMRNQLVAEMASNDSAMVSEAARLDGVLQERRTTLVVELREAQRDLEATRARLADNMKIMAIYADTSSENSEAQRRTISYSVVRQVNGQVTELAASEMTPIEAGDLVRVRYASEQKISENEGPSAELSAAGTPIADPSRK